jgi:hypothetical protein
VPGVGISRLNCHHQKMLLEGPAQTVRRHTLVASMECTMHNQMHLGRRCGTTFPTASVNIIWISLIAIHFLAKN